MVNIASMVTMRIIRLIIASFLPLWLFSLCWVHAATPDLMVKYDHDTFNVSGQLRQKDGLPIHGIFDFRITLWSTDTKHDYTAIEDIVHDKDFLWVMEDHEVQVDNEGGFQFDVGHYADLSMVKTGPVYMEVDWKPAGTENIHFTSLGDPISLTDEIHSLGKDYAPQYFQGTLLDDEGKKLEGNFIARLSLWRSANYDYYYDQLEDTSLLASNANWLGYNMLVPLSIDSRGQFKIDIGFLKDRALKQLPEDVFLQLDIMGPDGKGFELMDPDGDIATNVDRFPFTAGKFSKDLTEARLNPLGNSGKWLVTQVPSATSLNSFEIGATNTDPQAHIEIRANQGPDKKGVLRFNGITNKWEISSDGITFSEINAGYKDLTGVYSPTFTIGLGNDTDGPWELRFGDGGLGSILYDAKENSFVFSGDIDLGGHQLINAVLENATTPPTNPVPGQQYFNTINKEAYFFDGTVWQPMSRDTNIFRYGAAGGNTTIVQQVVDPAGTDSNTFTINKDNSPGNTNVDIIAKQGSDPDGVLRYNATTNQWEISNDGVSFNAIADVSSPQTFTNKTIDGDQNTITNIDFSSLKPREKVQSFEPGYPGVSLSQDGSNNKGILRDVRDSAHQRNAYRWSTSQATQQDYDLIINWVLPPDFEEFLAAPIVFDMRTESNDDAKSKIDVTFVDSTGAIIPLNSCDTLTTSTFAWEQKTCTFNGTPVLTPGAAISVKVKLHSNKDAASEIAGIKLLYKGK